MGLWGIKVNRRKDIKPFNNTMITANLYQFLYLLETNTTTVLILIFVFYLLHVITWFKNQHHKTPFFVTNLYKSYRCLETSVQHPSLFVFSCRFQLCNCCVVRKHAFFQSILTFCYIHIRPGIAQLVEPSI